MPKTSLTILFGRNALNIRSDFSATVSAGGEQTFAPASSLDNENSDAKLASFEPDFWLLDGTYRFAEESESVGYISSVSSNNLGIFVTKPVLQFDFGAVYSTDGMTLHFSEATGDWADDIDIAFYDSGLSLIRTDNYTPTGATFETGQAVANFQRIIITFNGTNKPNRFGRLVKIDFDSIVRWSGSNIKSGRLIEQVNLLSLELPSNEIEFTLFDDDGGFSITDPSAEYSVLQENEPIEAYEQVGAETIFLGRFYLDEWESLNENEARFTAVDAIGQLGKEPFYDVFRSVFSIDTADELIDRIMTLAGAEYDLDASLASVGATISDIAAIPVMSCRDALQQVLFSIGGYATCSRSRIINILPLELASDLTEHDWTLGTAEKGTQSPVKLRKAVTSVTVYSYQYGSAGVNSSDIFSQTLAVGTHIITFDHFSFYSFSGTSVRTTPEYGGDYVKVVVTTGGTFIVTESARYDDVKLPTTLTNSSLPATTPINNIIVSDCRALGPDLRDDAAQRVYDYYLQRYVQNTRLYGHKIKAGDSVLISSQSGKQIKGIVERAEFNLTGGFISDIEIIGVLV